MQMYGNPCSIELAMCGLSYGAAKSWNVLIDEDEFFESMDEIIYGFDGASKQIKELSDIHKNVIWTNFVWIYSNKIYPDKLEAKMPDKDILLTTLKRCRELVEKLNAEHWGSDEIRCELITATEAVMVMCEILCVQEKIEVERCVNVENWLEKYRKAWLSKNKESELREIENVFIQMNKM